MEFYYFKVSFLYRAKLVSIPNGMEFYCNFLKYETYDHAFQFPTGWNSTADVKEVHLVPS